MIEHTTKLRVRYADTDNMGIVYYAKYFEYFEVARTEMLRACGLPYAAIEASGFQLPVVEAKASYFSGAKYDEMLSIRATMPRDPSPRLVIRYEIRTGEANTLIATGETTLVFVNKLTGKPARPPKTYIDAINNF